MGPNVIVSPARRLQNAISHNCEEAWFDNEKKPVEFRGFTIQRVDDELVISAGSVVHARGKREMIEKYLANQLL